MDLAQGYRRMTMSEQREKRAEKSEEGKSFLCLARCDTDL